VDLITKIRTRGWSWFKNRALRELRVPETPLGKRIHPPLKALGKLVIRKKDTANMSFFLFYDLEICPVTYDFAWALVIAEHKRRKLGLTKLHVVLIPGPYHGLRQEERQYASQVQLAERKWRLQNIILPLIDLIQAPTAISLCTSREEAWQLKNNAKHYYPFDYALHGPTAHNLSDALTSKEDIMNLKASAQSLQYLQAWYDKTVKDKKLIVISLRYYDFMPARNSKIEEWLAFADSLTDDYFVVFVPDTAKALLGLPTAIHRYCCLDACSWNLHLRAALYELAYLNLTINNGPSALCWLNKNVRYLTFKLITDEVAQTTAEVMAKYGFEVDKDLPFAGRFQRWIWQDDTLENIKAAFNSIVQDIENAS